MKKNRQRKAVIGTLAAALAWSAHAAAATYYVAPAGNDGAAGSKAAPWRTFARAQEAAVAGDTIYFRGGTYKYTAGLNACASTTDVVNAITLNKSGTDGKRIRYWAYPGEKPVFDFAAMKDNCRVKAFNVNASWLHLKGLEIKGAPQQPGNLQNNESWGIWIKGSRNVFEALDTHHHMGPGLFLADGSYNLVLNVDSHHNYDPYSKSGAGQNADGFGAHVKANQPGNVFRGCRAWANTDDGFDLINAYSPVLIERSWAWLHGYLPGTTTPIAAGNGNGFKIGGFSGKWVAGAPVHVVRNSVALRNKANGFYANHHPVASQFFNNTAASNGIGYNLLGIAPDGSAVNLGVARNNVAYGGTAAANTAGADTSHNSWELRSAPVAADFESVSTSGWDAPRQADGSLPALPHFHLAGGSALVDAGIDVGLPYAGRAPDLGAWEVTAKQGALPRELDDADEGLAPEAVEEAAP
ncbi:right-handed parallel beta-helix repeat-containing protein [[Empedobacter] haloabium]|uniref:Right-handed parallel beta-helix repeat-containing protein n=1 Tax=[Empedobacter] haloabium TaxID=592317 RepID=A0ABZ1US26_9BURK